MTLSRESTLYALIVGCEIAFWIALFAGLALRYILKRSRLSALVLLCVRIPFGTVVFWFLFGPLWSLVLFKRRPAVAKVLADPK